MLDVTEAYIDTESRLSALKAEKQALESLLNKAGSLSDIMTVQKQLTEVISQIEAAEAKFKKYNNEIEFDTVTLTVLQVQNSAADGGTVWGRITNGFSGSLHALGTFFYRAVSHFTFGPAVYFAGCGCGCSNCFGGSPPK